MKQQHPKIIAEFRDLLPPLDAAEFAILEQTCLRDGIRDPILLWNGIVVDGHNRLNIAKTHKLSYKQQSIDLPDKESVKLWMVENQLSRRSITAFEKIRLALQFAPAYSQAAKKQKGSRTDLRAHRAPKFEPMDTLGKLAKIAGTGKRIIGMVRAILEVGNADIIAKCSTGQLSIRNAYLKSQDFRRTKSRTEQATQNCSFDNPPAGQHVNQIICGDALQTLKAIDKQLHQQVTCIITSPPYNTGIDYGKGADADNLPYGKYIEWLGKAIAAGSELLRPGGRLILNVASSRNRTEKDGDWNTTINADIITKVRDLNCGLRYYTEICWHKYNSGIKTVKGTYCSCEKPVIRRDHEYILVWSYERFDLPNINGNEPDLTASEFEEFTRSVWPVHPITRAKTGHPCTFPIKLITRLIKLFSYPGDIILDPFNGSGTATAAAASLNRKWIGIDQNPNYCKYARQRTKMACR